jgi:hypothetical protein
MSRSSSILIRLALVAVLPLGNAAAQDNASGVRICLAPAEVEGNAGSGTAAMDAVREMFASFLAGPTLSVTPMTARLKSQVREEAKVAGCGFLLLTTVKHNRKSGNGLLNRMAGAAAQQGVYSAGAAVSSSVGAVAGSAVASATNAAASAAASSFAGTVRSKDELELTYRLESAGAPIVEKTEKRKADSDGEDLMTPVVRKASEAIAEAAAKRKG